MTVLVTFLLLLRDTVTKETQRWFFFFFELRVLKGNSMSITGERERGRQAGCWNSS